MSHAAAHTPDNRTPQQLAEAILNHEISARHESSPSLTFRELLFMDHLTEDEKKHGGKLLWALKTLEEDIPLTPRQRKALAMALNVLAHYKKDFREFQNDALRASHGNIEDSDGSTNLYRDTLAKHPKQAHNEIGEMAVYIGNVNHIEKIIRILAQKLVIDLIEPKQKGRGPS